MTHNQPHIDIQQFKIANFLKNPRLRLHKAKAYAESQPPAAEALFYFFSNQYENISEQHIQNLNSLFVAAGKDIGNFMETATVLNPTEALQSEKLHVIKSHLAELIAACSDGEFSLRSVESAVANNLTLTSPFSDGKATCQESYEAERGMTSLRFTDKTDCFFLIQCVSSADSLYFPKENILVYLSHARAVDVKRLQFKLISEFRKIIGYAQASNRFGGVIASHSRPAHFYYESWPVLFAIHNRPDIASKIPCLIMRKGHDFNDLKLLFPQMDSIVLNPDGISDMTLDGHQWLIHIGNNPHLRRAYRDYEAADQYLLDRILQAPSDIAQQKAKQIDGCYPLVWIGVEGQKRCWLEQVEGYAYMVNELAKRFPNLGVVFDGWTLPFTPSEKSISEVKKDQRIAHRIIKKLNTGIKQVSVIGENSNTKIFVAHTIDFFICNFATGSLYVSRILHKPGFCHLSNVLAKHTLQSNIQIHPNRNVYLLPKKFVTDKRSSVSYQQTAKRWFFNMMMRLLKNKNLKAVESGEISYSINKKAFYQFVGQRLDKVLLNIQNEKIRLFLEPSFSIHPDVRHYLKMASYGNMLEVFPTLDFPKKLSDLIGFRESYLKQHIIYGVFSYGSHVELDLPSEFMVWLGNPLERVQLHAQQFAINAASENLPTDMSTIINAGHKALDNYYTRLISGIDVPFGECTETMLDKAIENLVHQFIFIGINERQAQSFDRLCTLMDWDRSLFPDQLPNKYQVDASVFSNEHLQKAQELIQYDKRLYEAALNLVAL